MMARGSRPRDTSPRLQDVLDNLVDLVYVYRQSPDPGFEYVSDAATAMIGYSPAEHYADPGLGQRIVDPRDRGALAAVVSTPSDQPVQMELRWIARDGRTVFTEHRVIKRQREDGSVAIYGIARDVTAVHEMQEQLKALTRQLRLVAENVSDVVIRSGVDGTYEWVSPSVYEVLGWTPEQVVGHSAVDFVHPDDLTAAIQARDHVVNGLSHIDEFRARCRDGSWRWVSAVARPIVDDEGQMIGRVLSMRDVHQQILDRHDLAESEQRYRLLAERTSDVIATLNRDASVRWVSPSVQRVLGWTPEQYVRFNVLELVHPDDLPEITRVLGEADGGAPEIHAQLRLRCADGSYRWLDSAITYDLDDAGVPSVGYTVSRDIHDRVLATQALRMSEERLRGVVHSQLDPWLLLAALRTADGSVEDLAILDANPAACAQLGRSHAALLGLRLRQLPSTVVAAALVRQMIAVVESGEPVSLDEEPFAPDPAPTATPRFVDVRLARVGDGVSVTWRDVTERRETREQLARLAHHDLLTGLANRAQLVQRMREVFARIPRSGTHAAVLYADVDRFKRVNDEYGHAAGDEVLRTVADRIALAVRSGDTVARLGGDEFVVILDGVHGEADACAVAQKLRTAVSRPLALAGGLERCTVSIGVAVADGDCDPDAILARADVALYRAKGDGRDRVVAYSQTAAPSA